MSDRDSSESTSESGSGSGSRSITESGSASGSYSTSRGSAESGSYASGSASQETRSPPSPTREYVPGGIDARPSPVKEASESEPEKKKEKKKSKAKSATAKPKIEPFVVGDRLDEQTGVVRYEFLRDSAAFKPDRTPKDEDIRAFMQDPACRAFAIEAMRLHLNGKSASTLMRPTHLKRPGLYFNAKQLETAVDVDLRATTERAELLNQHKEQADAEVEEMFSQYKALLRGRLREEESSALRQDMMLSELSLLELLPHVFAASIDHKVCDVPALVMLFYKTNDKGERQYNYELPPVGVMYKLHSRRFLAAAMREFVPYAARPATLGAKERPVRLRSALCAWTFGNFLAKRLPSTSLSGTKELLDALRYDDDWQLPCSAEALASLVSTTFECAASASEFAPVRNETFFTVLREKKEKAKKLAAAKKEKDELKTPKSRKDASASESSKKSKKSKKKSAKVDDDKDGASTRTKKKSKSESGAGGDHKSKRRRRNDDALTAEKRAAEATVGESDNAGKDDAADGSTEVLDSGAALSVGPLPPPRGMHFCAVDVGEVPGAYDDSAYQVRVIEACAEQLAAFEEGNTLRTVAEVSAAFANPTLESNTTSAQKRTKNGTKGVTTSRCALDIQSGRIPKVARSVLTETVEVDVDGEVARDPMLEAGAKLGATPIGANARNIRLSLLSAYEESMAAPKFSLTSAELHKIVKEFSGACAEGKAIDSWQIARVLISRSLMVTNLHYVIRSLARRGDVIDVANSESKDIQTFTHFIGSDKNFQAYMARCLLHAQNLDAVADGLMRNSGEIPKLVSVPAIDEVEGNGFDMMKVWYRS